MNKLFYGLLVALIALVIIFFAPAANTDSSQVTLPGSSAVGVPEQKNEVHPNVTNEGVNINAGSIGPNTVPNNVNTNGTVNTTPGMLEGTDNIQR
ncbi:MULTISPECIES: hypothetical protein [Legionella]|uniref:Uncharacterized protein n=1 Tax=Legionella maceachernii TaxID=466 RepID=A0A0W0WGU7_9GAMM|nr:hypothetical protein [Legionella maceachernii]KTD31562.1 hypothetical protein Lmac_0146 [Legionella maceachernii]SKA11601.1 hypothetical protein SAMN02745128_02160 [Legionella maceachernii]SUO99618.1 Uncharacterised protein [Legionella maceachernii]